MNPNADDLYECLGAHPQEPHGDLKKKVSRFVALHGTDYPAKKTTIEQELKDLDSRKEYNRNHGYPTTFGDIVPLSIAGPDVVEVGETVTAVVEDDGGQPVPGASVTAGSADLGETNGDGKCSFEFHGPGTTTITAAKEVSGDEEYADATTEIEIVKERRELAVETDAAEVVVGETVTVTVTADGETVSGATVATDGGTETTDGSGTCRLEFSSPSEKSVEATKDDDGEATYLDDATTVRVKKREVSLDLSADSRSVEVGETVSFSVTDGDGGRVGDVSLAYDGETVTTDDRGRADVTFEEAGTVVVEASKRDDGTARYESDRVEIRVGRRRRSLSVDASPDPVELGNTVTVRVTADGSGVSGASVTAAGRTKTTDGSGECAFEFSSTGEVGIRATKDDTPIAEYEEGTTTVTVTKATRGLAITTDKDTIQVREPLSVRVSDGTGGVSGAEVRAPSTRERTSDRGTCTLRLKTMGEVELTATRSDTADVAYESATTTVTVDPKRVDLEVTADPDEVEVGEDVEATVTADGDPVPDVEVRTDETVERTDDEGGCKFTPSSIRPVEITVDRDDTEQVRYLPDRTTVDVVPVTKELHVDVADDAEAGETVQVTVYDEDGGRVEGATVESPVDRTRTDDHGRGSVELPSAGRSPINVGAEKATEDGIHYGTTRSSIEVDRLEPPDGESGASTTVVLAVIAVILLFPVAAVALLFGVRSDLVVASLVVFVFIFVSTMGLTRVSV